jgi:hypothetical protein
VSSGRTVESDLPPLPLVSAPVRVRATVCRQSGEVRRSGRAPVRLFCSGVSRCVGFREVLRLPQKKGRE